MFFSSQVVHAFNQEAWMAGQIKVLWLCMLVFVVFFGSVDADPRGGAFDHHGADMTVDFLGADVHVRLVTGRR